MASRVEEKGSLSITVDMAPMPMASPGTSVSPGRWEPAMPAAAPMKRAGKTGPPRKLESEMP